MAEPAGVRERRILLTGATGMLGSRLAQRLVGEGSRVRAFSRRTSDVRALRALGVEIAYGDLADRASVRDAVSGADFVVHAGAGTDGTRESSRAATIEGTRNIVDACRANGIRKLVHISSCSVYGIAGRRGHAPVAESDPLESRPDRRGDYSAAKQEAEGLVTEAGKAGGIPTVVLRPGLIYGSGRVSCPGALGAALGRRLFVVFGNGSEGLPLVHVDNVVDAIVLGLGSDSANGEVFNVLDAEPVSKRMYVEAILRPLNPRMPVIYLPVPVLMSLTWVQEKLMAFAGRNPILTVYRLKSSQTPVRYSTARIETLLGWGPRRTFTEGAQQWVRETMQSSQADPASPAMRSGSRGKRP